MFDSLCTVTPIEYVIHYRFGIIGLQVFKYMRLCYPEDWVTQECQEKIRTIFYTVTLGLGALLFPAIEKDFIEFEYLEDQIKVTINTGAAFPSFIPTEWVESAIELFKPLFDLAKNFIDMLLRQ